MLKFNNVQPTVSSRNLASDSFGGILKESAEYFGEQGIQMVSGINEILAEDALFSAYVNKLSAGLSPDESEQLEQILENARLQILGESSINNITPLAGLVMPTIRKLWLKVALKNAIPTETAKVPTFTISYMKPYIKDDLGNRHYLPEAVRPANNSIAKKHALTDEWINVGSAFNLITESGGTIQAGDNIDPILSITKATVTVAGSPTSKEVDVDIKMGLTNQFYGVIRTTSNEATPLEVVDTLFGAVDRVTGELIVTSLKGLVTKVKVTGWLSSENNTKTQSVSFEIARKDIKIGTGAHINAPLPIEFIQDTMALYNIDTTLEVVDIMSNVVAQNLEHEIAAFFDKSFIAAGSPYTAQFDVKPAAGFAGSPTMWREEIKRVIDYTAIEMKTASAFTNGYFVIYGNPLDMQIIPNVSWTFVHTASERGGVDVDYDIGAYSSNNKYTLVSSLHVPQGKMTMFFVPGSPKYMTYKYYPYSFNIEKGYLDPQQPHVPNIMMTKRHTIEEFQPLAAEITILHNDGSLITSYAL